MFLAACAMTYEFALHRHLRVILKSWVEHCNRGRPHSALGHGVPDLPLDLSVIPKAQARHRLAAGTVVRTESVQGGLHHAYALATAPSSA